MLLSYSVSWNPFDKMLENDWEKVDFYVKLEKDMVIW